MFDVQDNFQSLPVLEENKKTLDKVHDLNLDIFVQ